MLRLLREFGQVELHIVGNDQTMVAWEVSVDGGTVGGTNGRLETAGASSKAKSFMLWELYLIRIMKLAVLLMRASLF